MRFEWAGRAALGLVILAGMATPSIGAQAGAGTVLQPADVQKIFPASVFYRGQTAPAQLRNSGGVKFADGYYFLASLVDTSGYSSGVAQKYQGYLITEKPLEIAGKHLAPGAYGFGFIAGNRVVITDVGGRDVLTATFATDSEMMRPRPLQVTADPAGGFRLYAGRSYIRWTSLPASAAR
jgi:hypothetical protein